MTTGRIKQYLFAIRPEKKIQHVIRLVIHRMLVQNNIRRFFKIFGYHVYLQIFKKIFYKF